MSTTGIISAIKSRVVPDESKNRRVLFGPFKGQQFDINLRHQLQLYLGLYERETYAASDTHRAQPSGLSMPEPATVSFVLYLLCAQT